MLSVFTFALRNCFKLTKCSNANAKNSLNVQIKMLYLLELFHSSTSYLQVGKGYNIQIDNDQELVDSEPNSLLNTKRKRIKGHLQKIQFKEIVCSSRSFPK